MAKNLFFAILYIISYYMYICIINKGGIIIEKKLYLLLIILVVSITSVIIYTSNTSDNSKVPVTNKAEKETIANKDLKQNEIGANKAKDLQISLSKKEIKSFKGKDLTVIGKVPSGGYLCMYIEEESPYASELRFYNDDFSKCTYTVKTRDPNKQICSACISKNDAFFVEASPNNYKDDWVIYRCTLNNKFVYKISESNCKVNELSYDMPFEISPNVKCDDNNVIWDTFEKTGGGNYKAVVKLYDIKSGKIKTLDSSDTHTPTATLFNLSSVNNGYALYALHYDNKDGSALSAKIYLVNLSTGEKKEINNTERACPVCVVYPKVMYIVVSEMHVYDVLTGKDEVPSMTDTEKWNFTRNNEYLTYWQMSTYKVPIYSLKYDKYFTLTDSEDVINSHIADDLICWKTKSEPDKIFYIKLK